MVELWDIGWYHTFCHVQPGLLLLTHPLSSYWNGKSAWRISISDEEVMSVVRWWIQEHPGFFQWQSPHFDSKMYQSLRKPWRKVLIWARKKKLYLFFFHSVTSPSCFVLIREEAEFAAHTVMIKSHFFFFLMLISGFSNCIMWHAKQFCSMPIHFCCCCCGTWCLQNHFSN